MDKHIMIPQSNLIKCQGCGFSMHAASWLIKDTSWIVTKCSKGVVDLLNKFLIIQFMHFDKHMGKAFVITVREPSSELKKFLFPLCLERRVSCIF